MLIVGAGFAGAVMAERFAACGRDVTVIDRRDHIAGNAHDFVDDAGIRVHSYGPHLFHANSERIVAYLSQFTEWHPYEHRVLASVDGQLLPIPINRTTLNRLYGLALADEPATEAFLAERAEPIEHVRTSEDAVISKVGRELYEAFFRGYTRKHWGLDPRDLHASVCARIPVRFDTNDRYFTDSHQAMPAEGYTAMFERLLEHPAIEVRVGTSFEEAREGLRWRHLVWTGAIDEYFGHCFGVLPYRSLHFDFLNEPTPDGGLIQPVAQVNYPDEAVPYTRVTEFRHITGQDALSSTRAVEYPRPEGEPYYPIPAEENQRLYRRYQQLARRERDVAFVGRMATYRYLNMDQVVGQALATFSRLSEADPTLAAPASAG